MLISNDFLIQLKSCYICLYKKPEALKKPKSLLIQGPRLCIGKQT